MLLRRRKITGRNGPSIVQIIHQQRHTDDQWMATIKPVQQSQSSKFARQTKTAFCSRWQSKWISWPILWWKWIPEPTNNLWTRCLRPSFPTHSTSFEVYQSAWTHSREVELVFVPTFYCTLPYTIFYWTILSNHSVNDILSFFPGGGARDVLRSFKPTDPYHRNLIDRLDRWGARESWK